MIFVSLGTQKFQFNRLLKEIDNLIDLGIIQEEVFAQTGFSTYKPKKFDYSPFLDKNVFDDKISECNLNITHGGTGAIISSLKESKRIIACPRLEYYGEHVDNHQKEIVEKFVDEGYILGCFEMEDLKKQINLINDIELNVFKSNSQNFNKTLEHMLSNILTN